VDREQKVTRDEEQVHAATRLNRDEVIQQIRRLGGRVDFVDE